MELEKLRRDQFVLHKQKQPTKQTQNIDLMDAYYCQAQPQPSLNLI